MIKTNHPALSIIREHFVAFNEEKGEKSIHEAFRHILDNDYTFLNLDMHYQRLNLLKHAHKTFEIPSSYKSTDSGYKVCNLALHVEVTSFDVRSTLISTRTLSIISSYKNGNYLSNQIKIFIPKTLLRKKITYLNMILFSYLSMLNYKLFILLSSKLLTIFH